MMTEQLGYSILSAPLAAIDRRALSQAWYSALHAAREPHAASLPSRAPLESGNDARPRASVDAPAARERSAAAQPGRPRAARPARAANLSEERRAQRSVLARRIEATFLDPARRAARATFTVDGTHARVHVALQSTPAGLRLIAICPPALRPHVVRALEQARYSLAARGISLRFDLQEAQR
jgi:hypothetical protein